MRSSESQTMNGIISFVSYSFQFGDWLVTYFDPVDYWKAHKSYVLCEIIFVIGGLLGFAHGKLAHVKWIVCCLIYGSFQLQHLNKVADGRGSYVPRRRMDSSWKMWPISRRSLRTFGTLKASSHFSIVGCLSTSCFCVNIRLNSNWKTCWGRCSRFRHRILLPCDVGDVENEFEKSFRRTHGRWTDDGADRYALWHRQHQIRPLGVAWYGSEYL